MSQLREAFLTGIISPCELAINYKTGSIAALALSLQYPQRMGHILYEIRYHARLEADELESYGDQVMVEAAQALREWAFLP